VSQGSGATERAEHTLRVEFFCAMINTAPRPAGTGWRPSDVCKAEETVIYGRPLPGTRRLSV